MIAEGRVDQAVEEVLDAYGARIFRMMVGVLQDEWTAEDAYQLFCIELWKSLSGFRGDGGIYTWTYTIARRVVSKVLDEPSSREVRFRTGEQEQLVAKWTRTATAQWRKTESREQFRELCEELDPDERTLVMLRIDEEMSWKEIAQVMDDGDETLASKEASRAAARLRKRFQRIKDALAARMATSME